MEEKVCLNGEIIPASKALVSAFDYGFLYGYGVFETMRAYSGVVFRMERHLERLYGGLEILNINTGNKRDKVGQDCYKLMEENRLKNARIRIAVTAGQGRIPPDLSLCKNPVVLITAGNYIPLSSQVYANGYRAVISTFRHNSRSGISGLKTTCYLENIMARREALMQEADEAVLLNEAGMVAEGSTSNIFIVSGNKVTTPSVGDGILPGITREAVIELCPELEISCREERISPEMLMGADEAFITGSVIEIMPLVSIGGRPLGNGKPGPITLRITEAYRDLVSRETQRK
jgi:branched-chain amino acid aminotransferase